VLSLIYVVYTFIFSTLNIAGADVDDYDSVYSLNAFLLILSLLALHSKLNSSEYSPVLLLLFVET